jgi:hypothetical protein
MDMWGCGVNLHPFLTLATVGGEFHVVASRGLKPSLNIVTGKYLPLPGIKTLLSSLQSLQSVYLDR